MDKSPVPQKDHWRRIVALCVAFVLALAACGSSTDGAAIATIDESVTTEDNTEDNDANHAEDNDADHAEDNTEDNDADHADDDTASTDGVDLAVFFDGALAENTTTEACTLSGGIEMMCYSITVAGDPVTYETGPFCPETITDTAEAGGLWLDGNWAYDVDGAFIAGLADLYDDDNWQMYDEDGNVNVTETAKEFDLAARPDVDPSLQNHCVEGRLEWLPDGEPISSTVLIPVTPVLADSAATSRGNLGVTLDGVVIAASAPVDAILSAYTIAAFDDCGGHYNPVDGYHLHGATGCSEVGEATDGETAMFAYAMDGFPVHSPLADATSFDLDECNGHETEDGYHYHANNAAENLVIECLVGQTATTASDTDDRPGGPPPGEDEAAAAGGPSSGQGPDFTAAATALGVTEDDLLQALGGPPPDFDAAATTLGITVEALQAALAIEG